MGLEMMGLRKAWTMNSELAAMTRLTKREEFNKRLDDAKKKGGLRAFLQERDGRFNRSRSAEGKSEIGSNGKLRCIAQITRRAFGRLC
jgi:hypothetical protein